MLEMGAIKDTCDELDVVVDLSTASEQVMIERLFDEAVAFYKNPENLRAFEIWQQTKEELQHGTNHSNT